MRDVDLTMMRQKAHVLGQFKCLLVFLSDGLDKALIHINHPARWCLPSTPEPVRHMQRQDRK